MGREGLEPSTLGLGVCQSPLTSIGLPKLSGSTGGSPEHMANLLPQLEGWLPSGHSFHARRSVNPGLALRTRRRFAGELGIRHQLLLELSLAGALIP